MTSNGDYIKNLLTELAACLCAQIQNDGLVTPCWCGVYPGSQVVADFMPECFGTEGVSDGMAWARLVTAYPAFAPGRPVEDPAESSVAGIGYDIEVGIARSISLDEDGTTVEVAAASVADQLDDMLAARRAIQCCVALERGDFILGQYTPFGPQGGMVGGGWTVMVMVP